MQQCNYFIFLQSFALSHVYDRHSWNRSRRYLASRHDFKKTSAASTHAVAWNSQRGFNSHRYLRFNPALFWLTPWFKPGTAPTRAVTSRHQYCFKSRRYFNLIFYKKFWTLKKRKWCCSTSHCHFFKKNYANNSAIQLFFTLELIPKKLYRPLPGHPFQRPPEYSSLRSLIPQFDPSLKKIKIKLN